MKDQGINKGLVQEFQTSDRRNRGVFYGFRKMFWTYLKKLNVAFYDPCCPEADGSTRAPIAYNTAEGRFEYYNGTAWVDVLGFTTSTTTTTTAVPTSTTTTTTGP